MDHDTPDKLLYTRPNHEWLRRDEAGAPGEATIGITDFAQDQVGDVVYLDLAGRGRPVTAGETLRRDRVDEDRRATFTLRSSGEVIAANGALEDQPELVNNVALRRGLDDPRAHRRRGRTPVGPARRRRVPRATPGELRRLASPPPGGSPHPYIPPRMPTARGCWSGSACSRTSTRCSPTCPAAMRDPAIDLPPALTEPELIALLTGARRGERRSRRGPNFLGAGAYRRSIPAVTAHLTSRSEFVTAYTPYQPEISQGTLQSAFEYQSVVCELTGMDVSNTGLYDVASATAEACLLAARATKRGAVALLEPMHPGTVEVVRTYARGAGLRVDVVTSADAVTRSTPVS